MRSSSLLAICAATVSAQSTVTLLNPVFNDTTVTLKGGDSSVTTYAVGCSSSTEVSPSSSVNLVSKATSAGTINLTPITALPTNFPTAKARLRRDDSGACEPYTIVQGASTWEFHLTDPTPGLWTWDINCNFGRGGVLSGDATCTASEFGSLAGNTTGVSTQTIDPSDLTSIDAYVTATVLSTSGAITSKSSVSVTPTKTPSGSASQTSAGAQSTGPQSTSTGVKSTGLAASVPLPTGAVAFVGGAAGILAAAMAL